MIRVSILARRHEPGVRRAPLRILLVSVLLGGCLDSCPENGGDSPTLSSGTEDFLDAGDFQGSHDGPVSDTAFSGQSNYDGYLVFANLPRTVVDDVLPSDLHLATNVAATTQSVHPIILMYGDQLNGTYVFPPPLGTVSLGASYKELIMLVPFVRRTGGTKWHNYVVRMYLDHTQAVQVGNQYYGYFKEMAVLADAALSATSSELDITQSAQPVFEWTTDTSPGSFTPSTSALGTLDNYQDAIDIMSMPLLGTLGTIFGPAYICSFWDWNLSSADVRPIKVTSRFVKAPRSGTASWVSQGSIVSDEKFAFQIRGLVWQLAFPPVPCSF